MTATVVVIGAGPAGLTAALELRRRSDLRVIVLEADRQVGGLSRTVVHHGNRIDIGGHRFFSKSTRVTNWWRDILPEASDPAGPDRVMLRRSRLSRIYYLRRFFDYPIRLSAATLAGLGPLRVLRIGVSYVWARLFPRRPERSLEDFLINRFGARLFRTFFKDYTEKVWGVPCRDIEAEWGAQRIKGLSVGSALKHALLRLFGVERKQALTSLIESFLYPKFGPGQMWEEVTRQVLERGGEVRLGHAVRAIELEAGRVVAVRAWNAETEREERVASDYVISTMPVRDLIGGMTGVPAEVRAVAEALPYRDFITVGLLVKRMRDGRGARGNPVNGMPPDNWIYIQEGDVQVGRLQIFNNWSPALVADPEKIWLGLEYFCNEGDALWSQPDAALKALAGGEMARIGLLDETDIEDAVVIRVAKAYPAYFGSYARFGEIRAFLDGIGNLYPVGRNGMHRYNNQDHSMLTAMAAVDNILSGRTDKANLWAVNVGDDYHEETKADDAPAAT